MRRICLGLSIATLACSFGFAETPEHPASYDEFIAKQAEKHGVPERLVHRIVMRESRYNPRLVHNHCFGLMQIKYGTARSMGYKGAPQGLLDPKINMTYAIPYLSNAYRVAEGDEDRAVALFAGGYYYAAKRKQLLTELRTAESPPAVAEAPPAPPPAPPNPVNGLFAFLQGGAPSSSAPQMSTPAPVSRPATELASTSSAAVSVSPPPPANAPICDPAVASLAQDGAAPSPPLAETTKESLEAPPNALPGKRHDKAIVKVAHKPAANKGVAIASASAVAGTVDSAPKRLEATQDLASPAAPSSVAKTYDKTAAKTAAPKIAHKPATKTAIAVASAEPSAQPPEPSKAANHPAPKAKDAKGRAKSTAAAISPVQSDAQSPSNAGEASKNSTEPAPSSQVTRSHDKTAAKAASLKTAHKPPAKTAIAVASSEPSAQPPEPSKVANHSAPKAKGHAKLTTGAATKTADAQAETQSAKEPEGAR
ncbi:transglycosylase SLT domain-containing protein [Methylocella tundrae]|uniref:Lytic transglycosylase catalytic n=1 Tax=Methylocella tundrae TaxID=227605 RepID=A0A4U8Z0P4_METTU|nr:transglycosylase SLT domain-containing protein [Methylocella tundrae]WPP06031.1 transglycosylase SLT domain-containing protein [Methylocella tundrae]VFU08612.1 Lytic transglycosylase catalytic [Methylocella tundrae]